MTKTTLKEIHAMPVISVIVRNHTVYDNKMFLFLCHNGCGSWILQDFPAKTANIIPVQTHKGDLYRFIFSSH